MKIGYQGIKGAYSYIASKYLFPNADLIGFTSFEEAFEALSSASELQSNKVARLVMPIENTIVGSINEVYDLIFGHKYWIKGEVTLKINHNLLGIKNAKFEEIQKAFSHPKALGQCSNFFKNNKIEAVNYEDTAVSAGYVSIKQDPSISAIASMHAAEIYNLEIIRPSIQNNDQNFTRFVVIDKENGKLEGEKTSLLFSTSHKPGSLLESLKQFSDLNLTYIESRPRPNSAWKYLFYLDFEHAENEDVEARLEKMKPHVDFVRRLGTFPKGKFIKEKYDKTVDIEEIGS